MNKEILIIHPKDNVATALKEIPEGTEIIFEKNGKKISIKANMNIPIYHKIALQDFKIGDIITKYGEVIGIARKDIKQGDHVHQKNIKSTFA